MEKKMQKNPNKWLKIVKIRKGKIGYTVIFTLFLT